MKRPNFFMLLGSALLLAGMVGATAHIAMAATRSVPTPANSVRAETQISVDEIQFRGLELHAGKALHVFYVSGREAALGMSGQTLKVRQVFTNPQVATIGSDGVASVPPTKFIQRGFYQFNYVVFAVVERGQNELFIRNTDGTYPIDPRIDSSRPISSIPAEAFVSDSMDFISVLRLSDLKTAQGNNGRIVVNTAER